MNAHSAITLHDMLAARDTRAAHERELITKYDGLTLIVLTVVMPGDVKRNKHSLTIARAASTAIDNKFSGNIIFSETKDLPTGFERFLIIDLPREMCKELACEIEDTHPLGRLFDIDVFNTNGIPISRTDVSRNPRKCIMCDNDARVCMRQGVHSYSELLDYISKTVNDFIQSTE